MQGYFSQPAIKNNTILFICESDLWKLDLKTKQSFRLTNTKGDISNPIISPDGLYVAYSSTEEGSSEIFICPLTGGPSKRLTFLGSRSTPLLWSENGKKLIINSNFDSPYEKFAYKISVKGSEPIRLPYGPCSHLSFGANSKEIILARHASELFRWKRYKGGTAGEFWFKAKDKKTFCKILSDIKGNITNPFFIKNRIYFTSDHQGIANLYSFNSTSKKPIIERHTNQKEYYLRNAYHDKNNIVYHAGGDLYIYDIIKKTNTILQFDFPSTKEKQNRKFSNPRAYLNEANLNPQGTHVALTTRGKLFSFANWSGAVFQRGHKNGVRYQLPVWLQDEKTLVAITDEKNGERRPVVFKGDSTQGQVLQNCDTGIVFSMTASPTSNHVAITNHKNELLLLDVNKKKLSKLDKSKFNRIGKPSWGPDGNWLTYSFQNSATTQIIKAINIKTNRKIEITRAVLNDYSPVFDKEGKYIFFSSDRSFTPIYDSVQFDLSFQDSHRLYAVVLNKNDKSPFHLNPQSPSGGKDDDKKKDRKKAKPKVSIDVEGLHQRLVEFPRVRPGDYSNLQTCGKKLLFLSNTENDFGDDYNNEFNLKSFDFEKQSVETIARSINNYQVNISGDDMLIREGNDLKVTKAGEKRNDDDDDDDSGYNLQSGWVNLNRIKLEINRLEEWKQMYKEAWLLQREHFWTPNMSGVKWKEIFNRYWKLLPRICTRSEFSDLVWEMQGELGTSHCYEYGGDYEPHPHYNLAQLGCSFKKNSKGQNVIDNIYQGDPTNRNEISPLLGPGCSIKEGDILVSIDGQTIEKNQTARELLLNQKNIEILIETQNNSGRLKKSSTIKTIGSNNQLLYRDWVEKNREFVHKKSNETIGYVHIPDMGTYGFGEFHRYFLSECRYEGLIIDIRFNGGGHVSQLILEKLNRKTLGYDFIRWTETPEPFPAYSIKGPINCLTNEYAGSDGDIFSHSFKLMKIGKLYGKRTWGGVIGINSQYSLSDGSKTTQPEYSFWFNDVGWNVENYGVDPDIVVENSPEDYNKNYDRQLDVIVKDTIKELKTTSRSKDKFTPRPNLSLPKLPKF
ncbi:MAG: peptidase [Planctomycetota bacterium]|nr:MAG: peptidase [Planctomycetota bacterium]